MRQASQKAIIARPAAAGREERSANNEQPTRTKQNAVSGDICPIGASPTFTIMGIPRCSTLKYIPKLDKKNNSTAASTAKRDMETSIRYNIQLCGLRIWRKIALPYNINNSAVLGAIGICDSKPDKSENPVIHLKSTTIPITAANAPHV